MTATTAIPPATESPMMVDGLIVAEELLPPEEELLGVAVEEVNVGTVALVAESVDVDVGELLVCESDCVLKGVVVGVVDGLELLCEELLDDEVEDDDELEEDEDDVGVDELVGLEVEDGAPVEVGEPSGRVGKGKICGSLALSTRLERPAPWAGMRFV